VLRDPQQRKTAGRRGHRPAHGNSAASRSTWSRPRSSAEFLGAARLVRAHLRGSVQGGLLSAPREGDGCCAFKDGGGLTDVQFYPRPPAARTAAAPATAAASDFTNSFLITEEQGNPPADHGKKKAAQEITRRRREGFGTGARSGTITMAAASPAGYYGTSEEIRTEIHRLKLGHLAPHPPHAGRTNVYLIFGTPSEGPAAAQPG